MSIEKSFAITDEYKISADKYQYIVLKKQIIETPGSKHYGETMWNTEAFIPKINDVVKYLVNAGVRENIGDIHAIASWINHIEAKFDEFLKLYKETHKR